MKQKDVRHHLKSSSRYASKVDHELDLKQCLQQPKKLATMSENFVNLFLLFKLISFLFKKSIQNLLKLLSIIMFTVF